MTLRRGVVCSMAACAPAIVTLALVAHFWTAGPRDFIPTWNDEIVYWNEVATFAAAGFGGGYFTAHEQPARFSASHFGTHGPAFPTFVGSIAGVFGWRPYSGFAFNLLFVTAAAAAWVFTARHRVTPTRAALCLATFWPLIIYLPSNMQEPVHFGVALLFAAVFVRLQVSPTGSTRAAAIALLVLASLLRPTWALMSIPLLWTELPRARWASVPFGLIVTAAAYMMFEWMAAPYPNSLNALAAQLPQAPLEALRGTWLRTLFNVRRFCSPSNGWLPEVLLRAEIVGLLVAAAVVAWRRPDARPRMVRMILILGLPLAAVLTVGWVESWRDFRALAPAFLTALLVGGAERPSWLKIAGVLNLLLAAAVIPSFVVLHEPRFAANAGDIRRFADVMGRHVAFDPRRPPWENTVLMHVDLIQYPVLGLPRGVGLSFVLDWTKQPLPPHSRYLLLRPDDLEQIRGRTQLTPLAETTHGTLYLNTANPAATSGDGSSP